MSRLINFPFRVYSSQFSLAYNDANSIHVMKWRNKTYGRDTIAILWV